VSSSARRKARSARKAGLTRAAGGERRRPGVRGLAPRPRRTGALPGRRRVPRHRPRDGEYPTEPELNRAGVGEARAGQKTPRGGAAVRAGSSRARGARAKRPRERVGSSTLGGGAVVEA
jgi:hypothetical protein